MRATTNQQKGTTQRSTLSGFGNNTQRTNENESQQIVIDENDEKSLEESSRAEQPSPQSSSKKNPQQKENIFKRNPEQPSVSNTLQ